MTENMDDDKVDIEIIQVDNPWKFLAREKLEHARSSQARAFQEIYWEMNKYCERMTDEGMGCYRPSVGEICAASSRDDGRWHRVKIESMMPQSHSKQVCCYMIDKGIQLIVALTRLVKLTKYFQEVPAQVLHCRLCGVQPLTLEIVPTDTGLQVVERPCNKWDSSAVDYMQKMVNESEQCQAEIVYRDSENTHYLRLYFTTRKGTVCFNQVLVDENYAAQSDADSRYNSLPRSSSSSNSVLNDSLTSNNTGHWSQPEPISMPRLIPYLAPEPIKLPNSIYGDFAYDSHKQSSAERNYFIDSGRFSKNNVCAMDKQEMSSACLQLNNGCSFPVRNKTESRMNITSTQSQKVTLSRETNLLSTVQSHRSDDQQSIGDPLQTSVNDSEMKHQMSSVMLSKVLTKAPQNINIGFGRGRGFMLPQNGDLILRGCAPGSLQKEHQRSPASTDLLTCADGIHMPPLTPDIYHPARTSALSQRTEGIQMPPLTPDIYHPARTSALSQRTEGIQMPLLTPDIHHTARTNEVSPCTDGIQMPLLTPDIHHTARTNGVSPRTDGIQMPLLTPDIHHTATDSGLPPRTYAANPLNDGSSVDSYVVTGQQEDKMYSVPKTPPPSNSDISISPRDGCYLQNSESLDISRQLEPEVQDVHIVPRKPDIPLLSRRDKPVPRPIFGVVVHGKATPSPICDVCDVPFKESVKRALDEMGIDSARSIQAFVWPAVLNGRHIVGVCPPTLGKTMSYVPSVVSLLLDKIAYIELPPGKGPIAIVIVPSWKNARNVYEMIERLNHTAKSSQKIKSHILYAGGTEDSERNQISLLQGCDILVATPHSLIRMLDQDMTSLKRMCHIILDDADILAKRFPKEVETVMHRYMLHLKDRRVQKKCLDLPKQVMMFASCWTKGLEEFYLRYTKEAVIAISSRVEAAVYGGVRQVVKLTRMEKRLAVFCNLLGSLATTKHRVVVFAEKVEEVEQLRQAAKSRSVYCLLIHEDLPSQDIEDTRVQWVRSSQSPQLMVMVCTDQCYEDLDITNATMVVHHGLPNSKTKFGNRLACMLDYFQDRTSSTKSEVEPVSQVILTNECVARAQSLYELLQRCPAEYSPQLEQYLAGYRMAIENSERKVLCPFLKSFGVCNVQNKCNHRHLMIPGQDVRTGDTTQSTLPTSGEVKIKVIYVENASRYYCHLLEHRSVPDNVRTDLRLHYQRLVMEMITFFSKENNQVPYIPSEDPFLDGVCAYKDSNGICYRAKVVTVRKKSVAAAAQYRLWLVDAGRHETAAIGQLLKLPQSLAQVPYQAVETYLCCVKPMDDDVEWTVEANTFINDLLQGKELVGRIMLSVGLTVWLLPLVHQVSLKSVGLTNDINVRQELLENKFALVNSEVSGHCSVRLLHGTVFSRNHLVAPTWSGQRDAKTLKIPGSCNTYERNMT